MTEAAEHRWLGYRPVAGGAFISVCSCGWSSPPQRTAGLAGALVDAHREEAGGATSRDGEGDGGRPGLPEANPDGDGPSPATMSPP